MKWLLSNVDREFPDGEVEQAVADIVEKSKELKNREWYELALSCIDLTTLNSTDNHIQGEKFARKVSAFQDEFPGLPNVAAICVYPTIVEAVKKNLLTPGVKLASVCAGFPSSQTFLDIKVLEVKMAIAKGATEIDIVLNLGDFLADDYPAVIQEISMLKTACGAAHLKVILETGALKTPTKIWKAALLAMQAGADFIKTSTGKSEPAATPEAAYVMCSAIKNYYEKTKKKVGFKAAGGIVEPADALIYIAIVKEVLGDEWLNNKLFRIGASRLANNLLTSIKGESVTYF
jgi:deoxyribose-phosphate aldolase